MAQYWGVQQEQLVYEWLSANTAQQFKVYDALYKSVRYMASSILSRYFIPTADHDEVRQDAINHLFCRLHKFNPDKGHTAYSYVQTILKNYYHEVCRNKKKVFAIQLEYYDDLENPEFEYSYYYEPFDETHFDFKPVFQRLEQARFKLLSYAKQHKKLKGGVRQYVQNEINFITETTEYLYQYKDSQGVSAQSMQEYVLNKMRVSEATVQKYMKKHLGISVWLCNDWESKTDKKYDLDYTNDDYCPTETQAHRQKRRIRESLQYKENRITLNENMV